jgi:hypothetical protein
VKQRDVEREEALSRDTCRDIGGDVGRARELAESRLGRDLPADAALTRRSFD